MKNDDLHALRNLLQVATSWNEMGRREKVAQALRDINNILGRTVHPAWKVGRQVFPLPEYHTLTLEADGPEYPVRMALETPGGVDVMLLSCKVARPVAELLLVFCDQAELAREQ